MEPLLILIPATALIVFMFFAEGKQAKQRERDRQNECLNEHRDMAEDALISEQNRLRYIEQSRNYHV